MKEKLKRSFVERRVKNMATKYPALETLALDYYKFGGGYTLVTGKFGGDRLMKPRGSLHEVWAWLDGYELAMEHAAPAIDHFEEFKTLCGGE